MTDHDELRERVAVAIMQSGAGPTYGDTLRTMADAAIAVVLEEAAKIAEAKGDEWATVWRNRMKADSHMEGKSDGADEIAAAIRAMIPKEKQDADKA